MRVSRISVADIFALDSSFLSASGVVPVRSTVGEVGEATVGMNLCNKASSWSVVGVVEAGDGEAIGFGQRAKKEDSNFSLAHNLACVDGAAAKITGSTYGFLSPTLCDERQARRKFFACVIMSFVVAQWHNNRS